MSRIAICEDESIVALDLRTFLRRNGFEVTSVHPSAEDLLGGLHVTRPDLVLMDIHLQGTMDGIEATAILHEQFGIPVILLTANGDTATIERARLTHPYAYILKPYDERELKTAIAIGLYRASMEKRLKASERRYRGLFENGVAPVLLMQRSGRIMEVNNAFSRLRPGISTIQELFANASDIASLLSAVEAGEAFGPVEARIRAADGADAWVLFSGAPIELEAGEPAYQCQAIDITERKQLQDQLIHAQKLSLLGRFAGSVAHDFNNVLTAILGYARLMRPALTSVPGCLAELDGIEQAAGRASALSRQLLMFSRHDAPVPATISIATVVRDVEKMLRRVIGEGASLTVRVHDGPDAVVVDRIRLEQALVNLAANARDAMPRGGKIMVETGSLVMDSLENGQLGPIEPGRWVFVRVRDEGSGIPPEMIDRIFEPFFTTKTVDTGTGLGLSTVTSIVGQAGGNIQIKSRVGQGTTVQLLFPLADGDQNGTALAEHKPEPESLLLRIADALYERSGRKPVLLLVEQDDAVRAMLETMLHRAGFEVLSAGHPGEAMLLAESEHVSIQLVLAELSMPLVGGIELARRIGRDGIPVPAVLLCSENCEDRSAWQDDELRSYVQKPFDDISLGGAIDRLFP